MVGAREGKIELAWEMKWVGGEVVEEAVKALPGREGRIRAPRAEQVEGDFSVGKEAVPEVVGEVRVVEGNRAMRCFFPVLTALSAGFALCICGVGVRWGTKHVLQDMDEKSSL
jgi:hypothetical protein